MTSIVVLIGGPSDGKRMQVSTHLKFIDVIDPVRREHRLVGEERQVDTKFSHTCYRRELLREGEDEYYVYVAQGVKSVLCALLNGYKGN